MQIAHTSDLGGDAIAAVRSLMDEAFGDEFTEDDWRHCLGGMHALLPVSADLDITRELTCDWREGEVW